MPRARDPNRDKAYDIYKKHNGVIDLIEIASQLKIPPGTVRGWKAKDKWEQLLNGTLQKNTERSENKKNVNNKPIANEVTEVVENDELNDKQRLFCQFYVKYRNKTKAYMKAYNCSYDNAHAHSYELWQNVAVKNEIAKLLNEYRSNIDLDIKDLFQWYLDIARSDINDFVEISNNMVRVRNGTSIDGTLVSEIKEGQYGVSVKLLDKQKAMQWLSEHIDLANEEQLLKVEKLKFEISKINGTDNDEELSKLDKVLAEIKGVI